jgi:hypothetical protein
LSHRELALRHPIEDDCNASLPLAFVFCGRSLWRKLEGLPLELKHRAKTVMEWWGAACVLAAVSLCSFSIAGLAQDTSSAPSTTAPARKTSDTNAAKAKPQAPAVGSSSKASPSASAKAHSASHSTAAKHPKSNTAVTAHNSKYPNSRKGKKKTARGQQKIDSERAQAIQEALIREHYMSGTPTGTWNQSSEDAMRRYQADHGWQSKTVPDSRALISLGLGPSHDHLLNPESAMTTGPFPQRSESSTPASHSADPGTRLNTNPATPADPPQTTTPAHDAPVPQ